MEEGEEEIDRKRKERERDRGLYVTGGGLPQAGVSNGTVTPTLTNI
jgi:hypothetical protein